MAGTINGRRLRSREYASAGMLRGSYADAMANTGGGADGAAIESGRLVGLLITPPYAAIYVTSSGRVLNL